MVADEPRNSFSVSSFYFVLVVSFFLSQTKHKEEQHQRIAKGRFLRAESKDASI
jgi:hypothetical protein